MNRILKGAVFGAAQAIFAMVFWSLTAAAIVAYAAKGF